ncbi:MAG: two-component sensor histidine kinase, partial [Lachnospiraceae bacterium]|nr:two-component sensor histidine kinase [Lachnospiraceae bacterium]
MKSVPKLIRRFVGILLLSSVLIVTMNFIALAVFMTSQTPYKETSPYNIAA